MKPQKEKYNEVLKSKPEAKINNEYAIQGELLKTSTLRNQSTKTNLGDESETEFNGNNLKVQHIKKTNISTDQGFQCNNCNGKFETKQLSNRHICTHHKDQIICKFFIVENCSRNHCLFSIFESTTLESGLITSTNKKIKIKTKQCFTFS